jgi:hypothetical protein
MSIDVELSGDRNVIKKEIYNRNSVMWNVTAKVIPVKRGQIEPSQNHSANTEQQTGKARNQATRHKKKNQTVHCATHILRKVLCKSTKHT